MSENTIRASGESFSFDFAFAKAYGIEAAVLIRHFQYWIRYNRTQKQNFHDGRTWSYQTLQQITDCYDGLFSLKEIKNLIEKLVECDVLIKGNFNKSKFDRTVWYAFKYEEKFLPSLGESKNPYESPKGPIENPKRENAEAQKGRPIPVRLIPVKSIPDINHHHQTSASYDSEDLKHGSGAAAELNIKITNTRGQEKIYSSEEIYKYFLNKPYSTSIVDQAIAEAKASKEPINHIFRFLESVCERLSKPKTTRSKSSSRSIIQAQEAAKLAPPSKFPHAIGINEMFDNLK